MMKTKPTLVALGAAAILAASATDAHAAGHANGFGEKGELIISADRLVPLFGYTHSAVEISGQLNNNDIREQSTSSSGMSFLFGRDFSSFDLSAQNGIIQPVNMHSLPRVAFDVTIINNLTLGAGIAFAFGFGGSFKTERVTGPNTTVTTKTDAPSSTAIGLSPRVGYILPLGEHFAFWPRAGLSFYSVGYKLETVVGNNTTIEAKVSDTMFALDLDPQLAIIPTEHFFITLGPMLNIPFAGNRTTGFTTGARTDERDDDISVLHFGIHAGIGGWLNLF